MFKNAGEQKLRKFIIQNLKLWFMEKFKRIKIHYKSQIKNGRNPHPPTHTPSPLEKKGIATFDYLIIYLNVWKRKEYQPTVEKLDKIK